MHDDPAAGLQLIGIQPDYGQLGGTLTLFDPRTVAGQLFRDVVASGLSTHSAIRLAVSTLGAGPFAYRQLSNAGGSYVYTLTGDDAARQRRARPAVTLIGTVSRGRACGR